MGIFNSLCQIIKVAVVNAFFTKEEQERIKALKKDGKEEEARELISAIIKRETELPSEK